MNSEETNRQSVHISQENLLAFVRAMIGGSRGREDDEHPLPPGPWDPVIRIALEHISVFGPQPEPWRLTDSVFGPSSELWKIIIANILRRRPEIWDAIGGGRRFGEEVELNPQPLPPRVAFLLSVARTVIGRAELIHEIADATKRQGEGEQHGIIIVGGYIDRFVDDFCGTDFRLKYPFPGPHPHWFDKRIDGVDLVVMAAQFEQAAKETFSPDLRQSLAAASGKLAQAGLSKMQ